MWCCSIVGILLETLTKGVKALGVEHCEFVTLFSFGFENLCNFLVILFGHNESNFGHAGFIFDLYLLSFLLSVIGSRGNECSYFRAYKARQML